LGQRDKFPPLLEIQILFSKNYNSIKINRNPCERSLFSQFDNLFLENVSSLLEGIYFPKLSPNTFGPQNTCVAAVS
jgi:hypothetical protein